MCGIRQYFSLTVYPVNLFTDHGEDVKKSVVENEMKKGKLARVLSGSFLLIMLIHVIVFTAIGMFTPMGWRLLVIFVSALPVLAFVWWLIYLYYRFNPSVKWPGYIPFMRRTRIYKERNGVVCKK